jgi:hypothetical protein
LRNSALGRFTAIGERCAVLDSKIGDYSYIEHDSGIVCPAASFGGGGGVRPDQCAEPSVDRICQHKITYCPNEYFLITARCRIPV